MKYVIIGNGAAGTAAAAKLRRLDREGEISILTAEGAFAYSKCLLSDYLCAGSTIDSLHFKEPEFYTANRLRLYDHHQVKEIDLTAKTVAASITGEAGRGDLIFYYDKLLIACGSKPWAPPIPGLEAGEAHFLNSLADAERLRAAAQTARQVVIVGAGFVGLEAAFNFRKSGIAVTIVEKEPRILPAQLDEVAARIIRQGLETEGIRVILNATIAGVKQTSYLKRLLVRNVAPYQITLAGGEGITADLLLLATGSRPNLDFLKPGQLQMSRGIWVDAFLGTSAPDVYAAGDVVESVDAVTGRQSLTPIWPNAVLQGEYAAANMAGCARKIDQLVGMQNASEFREIPLISMGMVDAAGPDTETRVDFRPAKGIYRKIVIRDDRIVGMIFLGDLSQAGVIGALLKSRTPVGPQKSHFLEPNFGYGDLLSH